MRIGISALLCNMEKALKICRENKMINHIEIGIDSIDDCRQLRKYVPDFEEISHMKGGKSIYRYTFTYGVKPLRRY